MEKKQNPRYLRELKENLNIKKNELAAYLKAFPKAKFINRHVSGKAGAKIEDDFNAGRIPILFGQTSTIAHGLNLQSICHTLVISSLTANLEDYIQVIKRLHRDGQKNPVTILHLIVENSIDGRFLNILNTKDMRQNKLLNALKDEYGVTPKRRKNKMSDIDYFVLHQANLFINTHLVKKLKLDPEKVPSTIEKYGNPSSVSIPLTMVSELKDKLDNKKILMSGFGVGMTWASCVVDTDSCSISEIVEY